MKKLSIFLLILLFTATMSHAFPGVFYSGNGTTFPNSVEIGSTTAGKNLTVYGTRTSIHTFTDANWNEDGATWTMGATGPLVHVTGNTTTVTATLTEAIVAGTTYRVTITGTGGGGTATYTLGGVTGSSIAASGAIAVEDFITASTIGGLIISPASASTVSITSITVEKIADNTGDVTVDGNLRTGSQILAKGRVGTAYPHYAFESATTTGMGFPGSGILSFYVNSSEVLDLMVAEARLLSTTALGWNGDLKVYRDAANTLALRNSTAQQTFRFANTYTDASNYERGVLTGTAGSNIELRAETAGTGGDNLDVVLTPAGTGGVLSIFKEVNVATDTTLTTAAQVSGVQYNNYGQAANVTLWLPAISAGKSFRVVLGTTAAYYWRIDPNGTDVTYLDGVSTGAGKYIGVSSAAAGNELVCKSAQTGASSYSLFCSTISGPWTQEP